MEFLICQHFYWSPLLSNRFSCYGYTSEFFLSYYFGRSFLKVIKANTDSKHETISIKFGTDLIKFHFFKFKSKPYYKELEEKEGQIIVDLLQQHTLEYLMMIY